MKAKDSGFVLHMLKCFYIAFNKMQHNNLLSKILQ